MLRSVVVVLVAMAMAGHRPVGADNLLGLVAEGEAWWTRSPDPRDPVACATCHYDPGQTRGWAASFPKYRPVLPPGGRVMTLLQANAEAVRRHYGLADPEKPAVALTAYLVSRGAGAAVSPGIVAGQPAFEGRLRALDESVGRGERLFGQRCRGCHAPTPLSRAALFVPRPTDGRVEPLEHFLGRHRPGRPRLEWDDQPTADIVAFLISRLAGQPLGGWP